VSPSSPTVLAAGRVTRNDSLTVELHQPPDSPAFILLRWRQAASVVEPKPRGLAGVASLVCGSPPKHKASWPPSGHPNYDRSGTVPTCPLGRPLGLGRLAVHPRHRVVAARLSSFHNGGNCALAHSDRPWPLQRLEARPDSTFGAPPQARDCAAAVGAHLDDAPTSNAKAYAHHRGFVRGHLSIGASPRRLRSWPSGCARYAGEVATGSTPGTPSSATRS